MDVEDHSGVERARKKLGLSLDQLWLAYFELGGEASALELEAYFEGLYELDRLQHDVLMHALNERFVDLGQNHPMSYAFEEDR